MNQEQKDLEENFRQYAWNYFQIHAEQRLKAFQFYITLATAIVGGALLIIRFGSENKWIAVLGFFLTFLSFVFWKLDCRTRELVHVAERALKFLDNQHDLPTSNGVPHPLAMFDRDDHSTQAAQCKIPLVGHFSYTRCFKYVFAAFGLLGFVGGVLALILCPL